ncbi:MAG TPA: hypothetical protein VKY29_02665 [Cryomorphaceae bacterium]|nr:hypothetical protein [Cryomorphaceae bacterium]
MAENKTLLFSVDPKEEAVLVSESVKGSREINFVERVPREANAMLFDAVATLTAMAKSPDFDAAIFRAMDKVCRMIYLKHRQKNRDVPA